MKYKTLICTCVIGAASLDKQLQGRELLWQRDKNQSTITWPKKFEESHTATSPRWQLEDIGLPQVSNSIWCLAPQQRETSCCTVNISLFLSTLSSSYPSLCVFFSSIQVLGSWEGSLGRVSPNTGKGIREGFELCAPSPLSLALFPCSIHPSIRKS